MASWSHRGIVTEVRVACRTHRGVHVISQGALSSGVRVISQGARRLKRGWRVVGTGVHVISQGALSPVAGVGRVCQELRGAGGAQAARRQPAGGRQHADGREAAVGGPRGRVATRAALRNRTEREERDAPLADTQHPARRRTRYAPPRPLAPLAPVPSPPRDRRGHRSSSGCQPRRINYPVHQLLFYAVQYSQF